MSVGPNVRIYTERNAVVLVHRYSGLDSHWQRPLALGRELAGDDTADPAVVGAVAPGGVADAADHATLHDHSGNNTLVLAHPSA